MRYFRLDFHLISLGTFFVCEFETLLEDRLFRCTNRQVRFQANDSILEFLILLRNFSCIA